MMRVTGKDYLVFGFLIVLCALLCTFVFSGVFATEGETVEVYQAGKLVGSFPLSDSQTFEITDQAGLTVKIENDAVSVDKSACPGQDCVHTPPISKSGQSILCAPQQILIKIISSSAPDAVAS